MQGENSEINHRKQLLNKITNLLVERFGNLIVSIAAYGSTVTYNYSQASDIDLLIIFDDTQEGSISKTELIQQLEHFVKSSSDEFEIDAKIFGLTDIWKRIKDADPITYNVIKNSVPVMDRYLLKPIKALIEKGQIAPSAEAIKRIIDKAPRLINKVEATKVYSVVEDLYTAIIESAQAVLMSLGKPPPVPLELPGATRRYLLEINLVDEDYASVLEEIIQLRKKVEHKQLHYISGKELDEWIKKTKNFINTTHEAIIKIETLKRKSLLHDAYLRMKTNIYEVARALNKKVSDSMDPIYVLKKLISKNKVFSVKYLNAFSRLQKLHEQKPEPIKISEDEIYVLYVIAHKFSEEAQKIIKGQKS